ncbi:hypothetical protein DFJ73DRAFT_657189 [Zopfochytrium polystomum]|nr:hypothetical protein DFJ73DRAFT_657189 [Zopfochytrium polystomum]
MGDANKSESDHLGGQRQPAPPSPSSSWQWVSPMAISIMMIAGPPPSSGASAPAPISTPSASAPPATTSSSSSCVQGGGGGGGAGGGGGGGKRKREVPQPPRASTADPSDGSAHAAPAAAAAVAAAVPHACCPGAATDVDGDEDGYEDDRRFTKYYKLTEETVAELTEQAVQAGRTFHFGCSLSPSCSLLPPFSDYAAYERHYEIAHVNVCSVCRRVLPTARLLDIHLCEVHDSFFKVIAEKQKSYECFVDGCPKKCSAPFGRRLHLISKHRYPKNFDFDVVLGASPVQKTRRHHHQGGQHRNAPSKAGTNRSPSTEEMKDVQDGGPSPREAEDADMDSVVSGLAKVQLVPKSIRFGRSAGITRPPKPHSDAEGFWSWHKVKTSHRASIPEKGLDRERENRERKQRQMAVE